ncbi:MAG: hypothetical protein KKE09_19125 [Bacteroidetes bacterium]|nr:hypothetical protein [Bacteroidota bacterium]
MKRVPFILLILISGLIVAQDSTNTYDDYLDDNVFDFFYKSQPMFEINYGYGIPTNKTLENKWAWLGQIEVPGGNNVMGQFANIGNLDIKFGRSEQKNYAGKLVDLNERFIFASYLSSSIQSFTSTNHKILTDVYRFGFGSRDGIGFGGSTISVVPYISRDFVWTYLNDYDTQIPLEGGDLDKSDILDNYLGSFRFGDKSSYGIKVELASMIQLNANYETSVVYRRHLFWYWSGSMILSQVGYNLLSRFTDDIVDRSPVIGTIFNFALKAGYQYGYYLLRKEDMNWPFNTSGNEAPLTFETFNFGVSFIF